MRVSRDWPVHERFLDAWESLTIAADPSRRAATPSWPGSAGVGKDSVAAVTLNYFHVWTLRDGRVIRLESILRGTGTAALGG